MYQPEKVLSSGKTSFMHIAIHEPEHTAA